MKEQNITPQESMEIITGMIQTTRYRTALSTLKISIMWAVVTIVSAAAVLILLTTTHNPRFNAVWLAIPVLGFPLNILILKGARKESYVRTFIDTVRDNVWRVVAYLGVGLTVVCAIFNMLYTPQAWMAMFFYAFIVVGFGAAMQGFIMREKSYTIGGVFSVVCGFVLMAMVLCGMPLLVVWVLPLYILCFLLMFVIPGLIVARRIKHENN